MSNLTFSSGKEKLRPGKFYNDTTVGRGAFPVSTVGKFTEDKKRKISPAEMTKFISEYKKTYGDKLKGFQPKTEKQYYRKYTRKTKKIEKFVPNKLKQTIGPQYTSKRVYKRVPAKVLKKNEYGKYMNQVNELHSQHKSTIDFLKKNRKKGVTITIK